MSIFVSIASYRDPELVPTVEDCLAKARDPGALRFGICWQHGPEERWPFAGDPRFRVLDVDWQDSRGACWARAGIMGLYDGEDYFLQLDSHHRFAEGWDAKVLAQLERTGSARPLLTTYATPFTPGDPASLGTEPMQMNFDRFTPEGIVLFRPGAIAGWATRTCPLRSRFVSAHFLFTLGTLVKEVPYDPELYFTGEEITLAVRAFTHGYDFFHPTEIIVWHEYTRAYRPHKHWSDHRRDHGIAVEWHERDAASLAKVRRFLHEPWVGRDGCGSKRTFAEYEAYAGLSFRHKRAQDYTRRHLEPPNPPAPPGWAERVMRYDVQIDLERATLPPGAERARFWYVGFHDAGEGEIFRQDLDGPEVQALCAGGDGRLSIRRVFESEREPASWTVWPCTDDAGWLDKIRGQVAVREQPVTFVTALVDIGRESLGGGFARSFRDHYLPLLARLLAVDAPMVVHVEPEHEAFVWQHRTPHNTSVVHVTRADLEAAPHFARVQEIRARPDWVGQADWLAESPQARLPHYNPLVFSKMRWLRDVARKDPFRTRCVFWIDAGICHTVGDGLLRDPDLPARLADASPEALFVAYPYQGRPEVHGFPSDALARFAGRPVERVLRGGFFGGPREAIEAVAALYEATLSRTLAAGHMGTEETILAILGARYPELLRRYAIAEDGLLGPFFEAVRDGRVEALLVRDERAEPPPPAPAAVSPAAPGIVSEDPEGARAGQVRFMGLAMQQNRNAVFALDALWRHLEAQGTRVARIIELGAGGGGLTALLQVYALSAGAQLIAYDLDGRALRHPVCERLGIDLRVKDISHEFVAAEIAREIQGDGVTVLLCDDGDKVRDAQLADYLKTGDLLLVHDYAASAETFRRDVEGRLWSWLEATDDDLREASERNGLREILAEVFHPAVWTCRVKEGRRVTRAPGGRRGQETVSLYVLSFNAPAQLGLWLDSVERADPAMLERTDRVLLNNSTDASTFAAYDALSERYGFRQERHGNLGITGGRAWCARHFEEATSADVLLYFEDDMLVADDDGTCRNGLRIRVPQLLETSLEILLGEAELDFLKLSFTELHGDHRVNWAYHNLDPARRQRDFPDGHATRVEAIKSYAGLGYVVGEVFYSNWPALMTRRGNHTLFLRDPGLPLYEQALMVRSLELEREGLLRGAVLLASPIRHHRAHHYDAAERKEA